MSKSNDSNEELQEQLARTDEIAQALARQKSATDLKEARERWRVQETEKTEAQQQERYEFVAGRPRRYVGVSFSTEGVKFELAEWTLLAGSITLTREETLALIAGLQENMK